MYGAGSRTFSLDLCWQQFAASLRKGQIYVKMPVGKARALGTIWNVLSQKVMHDQSIKGAMDTLIKTVTDEAVDSRTFGIKSVFYMLSVDDCKKDIEVLNYFVKEDQTGVFRAFMDALEGGLRSDSVFDWITRVGGPSSHPSNAPQRNSNPVDVLFEDLDFPDEPNA